MDLVRLNNQAILVTGTVGGFGRRTGEQPARADARVVATDLNAEGAEETARLCRALGVEAWAFDDDVTSEQAWKQVMDDASKATGGLLGGQGGGITILTKSVAAEFARAAANVRVNSLRPGPGNTPLLANGLTELLKEGLIPSAEEATKTAFSLIPLGVSPSPTMWPRRPVPVFGYIQRYHGRSAWRRWWLHSGLICAQSTFDPGGQTAGWHRRGRVDLQHIRMSAWSHFAARASTACPVA